MMTKYWQENKHLQHIETKALGQMLGSVFKFCSALFNIMIVTFNKFELSRLYIH
jgi:hypothetical protein